MINCKKGTVKREPVWSVFFQLYFEFPKKDNYKNVPNGKLKFKVEKK